MALPRITSSVPSFADAPLLNDNKNRGASSEQTPRVDSASGFSFSVQFTLVSLGVGVAGWMLWRRFNPPTPLGPQSTVTTPAAPPSAVMLGTVSPSLPTTGIAISLPAGATGLPDHWQYLETTADGHAREKKTVGLAIEGYANALRALFDRPEMTVWRRDRIREDPTLPMPYAGDVVRLRQKLTALVTPSMVTVEGNEGKPASAILLLGPELGKQAVETLFRAVNSPAAAGRLVDILGLANVLAEDVPDFDSPDEPPFILEHFQALRLHATLLRKQLITPTATPQDLAAVANAHQRVWDAASDETQLHEKTEALREAVHYYSRAVREAVRQWQDPTDHVVALTELVVADDGLVLTSDVRALALRFLSDTWSILDEPESWAALALRAYERVPTNMSYAFDAATQLFIAGDDTKAAEVFRKMFDAQSPAGAAFEVVWRAGEFSVSPVLAALKVFGRQLDDGDAEWKGARPDAGFDLLQRTLAELVDAVVRSAAPHSLEPTLVDRLDPWVRYTAALTEVMESPDAQLALDESVLFLQSERLKNFDPVEIRKALKGEGVAMDLALALNDAIPLALRPSWKAYAEAKDAERRQAEKPGRAEEIAREREHPRVEILKAVLAP